MERQDYVRDGRADSRARGATEQKKIRRSADPDAGGFGNAPGDAETISLTDVIVAVAGLRKITDRDVIDNYSPALCELIYRAHWRELLREKVIDISIINAGMAGGDHAQEVTREIRDNMRDHA